VSETCRKWILQRRVVVLVRDGLRAPLMMAMTTGCYRENEGLGEIHIKERKGELQREMVDVDRNLHRLP
jgi:hypothetical protein